MSNALIGIGVGIVIGMILIGITRLIVKGVQNFKERKSIEKAILGMGKEDVIFIENKKQLLKIIKFLNTQCNNLISTDNTAIRDFEMDENNNNYLCKSCNLYFLHRKFEGENELKVNLDRLK